MERSSWACRCCISAALRRPDLLFALGIAMVAGAVIFPEPALLVVQASALGAGLVGMAVLLDRYVKSRRGVSLVVRSGSSSIIELGSTKTHGRPTATGMSRACPAASAGNGCRGEVVMRWCRKLGLLSAGLALLQCWPVWVTAADDVRQAPRLRRCVFAAFTLRPTVSRIGPPARHDTSRSTARNSSGSFALPKNCLAEHRRRRRSCGHSTTQSLQEISSMARYVGRSSAIEDADSECFLSVTPLSLALGQGRWSNAQQTADLGIGSEGKTRLLVTQSDEFVSDWSLRGRRDGDDQIFHFELPVCAEFVAAP